jgi:drug/metabolite transporter (DMT)-like permease
MAALLVMVAWAANFIVVKAANTQIPPIAFAFLRFASAAALLLVLLRWREGSVRMPGRVVAPILGLGAIGFGAYQLLWPTALQVIPAGDSAFLVAATPGITALIAARIGVDVLTRRKLVGVSLSFAGVGVVMLGGPGLSLTTSLRGDLLTLGAALCWGVYSAFGAPVLVRHSPLRTTAWAMVGGAIVLAPVGLLQAATTDWPSVGAAAWAGLAFSALVPAGIANVVVFAAIRRLGPTRVTSLQSLVPFIAVVLAALFLAEPIGPLQLTGGAIIVAGVALARSSRAIRLPVGRPVPAA